VHVMMRQAADKGHYKEACDLYQQVLDTDKMKGSLDIQLRLAWCHEHLGNVDEACALYRGVIKQYTDKVSWGWRKLYSRRPVHLQVMRSNDDYLWKRNRHIELHGAV